MKSVNTPENDTHRTVRRISFRSKAMLALGCVLIILGLFIDWPAPQEPNLPDTSLFLVIVGGLLGATGLLSMLRHQ